MLIEAEAVLFDNDGVLVDSHREVEQAWTQLAVEFDLDVERLLVELIGVRSADTLGRYLPPARCRQAVERLEQLEVELAPETRPLAGALDVLEGLGDPNGRWTIVTSASRRLANARWAGAGIALPPQSITAEDVTRGKPDPEPFLAGARLLGVEPARCVIFEDSPSGGAAALATGATVVAVGRLRWAEEPTVRVADLRSVRVVPNRRLAIEVDPLTLAT